MNGAAGSSSSPNGILKDKSKDKTTASAVAGVRKDRHKTAIGDDKKQKLTFADDPKVGAGKVRETVEVESYKQYNQTNYGSGGCCSIQ
mmetsp:Transcript_22595/g.49487  ORF Transcript_22595/g.49487 Transcript_22595/m.49487 type:complete len:88 (-) Transcript_22595:188-451(-)